MSLGNNILIVCICNICRSPAAEGFVADYFEKNNLSRAVASAGIHALVGEGAASHTTKIMKDVYGIDVSAHRARQLTTSMMRDHDLILAMESGHVEFLKKNYPFAAGKTFVIGRWREIEIDDPYRQSEDIFEKRIALIRECTYDWLN